MYLHKAIYENIGPIESAQIDLPFHESGNPKPLIIVGENGTGKSTVLSNIVDAFYEMAGKKFSNAQPSNDEGRGSQYFKAIAGNEVHSGASYLVSYLSFGEAKKYQYAFKCGKVSSNEFFERNKITPAPLSWNENGNSKTVLISKEDANDEWSKNVICYFGPDRYERPSWLGQKYYDSIDYLHPSVKERWDGRLDSPITVKNVTHDNLQWLLDIIADSRADIRQDKSGLSIEHVDVGNLLTLRKARSNVEQILSSIVGEQVYFSLNFRSAAGSRFKIIREKDNSVFCPSLDSLSTGQSALFNMFATIVRYADRNDINKSINLFDIQGIVVIDEIELHLHSNLQKEVLPKLIKLFPKIQFIITSHSPLFLLGMRDLFGEDGFEVYEMPTATKIDVEKFSEFQKAYEYIKQTQKYHEEAEAAIHSIAPQGKTIVITEGHTDWKHMKAALNALKADGKHNELLNDLDFEFLEFGPKDSLDSYQYKLEMGNTVLCSLCENIAKLPQNNKYVLIADRDDKTTNKKLSVPDGDYKSWGNNVYSFILPLPPHRIHTPDICIEHLYTDEEIKAEWINPEDGIARRLFIGNEFDQYGHAIGIQRFCERKDLCGEGKISIIEGTSGEKVLDFESTGINYAIPKAKFAELILNRIKPFDNFNFENFIPLFEIIKKIIQENVENE